MKNPSSSQNWLWIYVFVCNASGKTTICGLTKCPIHPQSIPYSVTCEQQIDFIPSKRQQWARACGIHWAYHVPHHSEAVGLIG